MGTGGVVAGVSAEIWLAGVGEGGAYNPGKATLSSLKLPIAND